jgi:pyruvate formate lyase activating enzyme
MKKEALLYTKLKGTQVQCILCAHRCKIADQKFGFCGVRQNIGGIVYTYAYGEVIASHVDPIEKKPLYHFLPGSQSFSIAAPGCNFRCGFCQNWQISQLKVGGSVSFEDHFCPATDIVNAALAQKCASISYTYTEPTLNFEYNLAVSKLAKEKGLRNVWVTNGFMTLEALAMIQPYMDAANVDLKFFNEKSYKKICAGSLKPVQETIKFMRANNIWVEVTTLVVPGKNDSPAELKQIAQFLAGIDVNIPWHVSKFFPDYQYATYNPTSDGSLQTAADIGNGAGLRYVYVGNVFGWGSSTSCPSCKKILVKRENLTILEENLDRGRCKFCQEQIPGIYVKEDPK